MVQGDHREIGQNQLLHQRVVEIRTDNGNAVDPPVQGVLQIALVLVAHITVDEGDVVAAAFALDPEAVEGGGKILVHEAVILQVHQQDAQVVGAVGFECAGSGISRITKFFCGGAHTLSGRLTDVLMSVEGLADRGHGNAALLCNVFHGNHAARPPALNRFRDSKIP